MVIKKIGLDFGTSNSAASFLDSTGKVIVVDLDVIKGVLSKTLKSVIYFDYDQKNFLWDKRL